MFSSYVPRHAEGNAAKPLTQFQFYRVSGLLYHGYSGEAKAARILETSLASKFSCDFMHLRLFSGGQSLTVRQDEPLQLDGSRSKDPNDGPGEAFYVWECEEADTGDACYFVNDSNHGIEEMLVLPQQAVVEIPAGILEPNKL